MSAHDAATTAGRVGTGVHLWWTRRALLLHLALVVAAPSFAGLFWWQVQRVREGNTLSWAYVFEWPIFLGYAIYLWWKLVHDQVHNVESGGATARTEPDGANRKQVPAASAVERADRTEQEDEELAAYNRYLAELNTSGRRKSW